ncbi:MAG: hypothetical protein A3B17_01340 [Candidatus Yanofskybacteria bacterium RIFCSPLOWO2_01_FULL_45_72]|uniref:Septation protein SpoVG n=1 Tax=Candidatus Yanofskybacteria bacterium RIFCSPLOWO2_02_FULL_45_18 TaxID=1802707 RepID=A0A1F8H336_9BACT|nr:MAG: hypothetical protein A3B17_01340 [Candidatus Yanofskybacteria bacterium RIFCSPLOWO2_01_FULL_45_72]OGN32001.1 MAG: hypothetical protein A3J01_02910 [Candidatus Yanofskybacteria bacterium RIFCSPLOWO2_02_FULL_45_18]
MDIEKIEIKVKIIEEKKLKAIITINFGDFVIKGFRVAESEYPNERGDKLWITPPSYRDGSGRYHPIFFMPDKELWEQLKKKMWDEYYRQLNEYHKKRFDLTDDNIPIIN